MVLVLCRVPAAWESPLPCSDFSATVLCGATAVPSLPGNHKPGTAAQPCNSLQPSGQLHKEPHMYTVSLVGEEPHYVTQKPVPEHPLPGSFFTQSLSHHCSRRLRLRRTSFVLRSTGHPEQPHNGLLTLSFPASDLA